MLGVVPVVLGLALLAALYFYFAPHPPSWHADYYDHDNLLIWQMNYDLVYEQEEERHSNPDYVFFCRLKVGGKELYIPMTGFNRVCDHIYDTPNGVVVGEFLCAKNETVPNPRGLFLTGDYLYYNYGTDRKVDKTTLGGPMSYELRSFKFARINLLTMENEKITKREYEREFENAKTLLMLGSGA